MTDDQLMQQLTDVFQNVFDDPDLVIGPETTAKDIPEWDSFNHINLIVAAEMHFSVKFASFEIEDLKNVGEFLELVRSKIS